ncbi:MAG: hypothetical protein M0Z60_06355 [Nitrospiraceae bacterium]|nr:hypothetical protein [Nitrospiraceae bacterium]
MKIDISKEEYRALLDLLQIADWVLHAHKTEEPAATKPYRNLEQKLFSLAKEFGYADLVEFAASQNRYYPTRELEENGPAMDFVEEFEEDAFWSQLAKHLSERDLRREIGEQQLDALDRTELWEMLEEHETKYWEEFQKYGVERLEVIETPWHETPNMPRA